MQNFFVEISSVQDGIIRLSGADVNHMKNVLRMKPGEQVQIQDGLGITYTCRISGYEDREAVLEILETKAADTELPSALYLFQGLPKGDKMEWIVQKAVELGAAGIIPFAAGRSVVRLDEKKAEKKEMILRALERMDISADDSVLMIGDRVFDIEGGIGAGVRTLGVGYGFGGAAELRTAGADYIALTAADIRGLVV